MQQVASDDLLRLVRDGQLIGECRTAAEVDPDLVAEAADSVGWEVLDLGLDDVDDESTLQRWLIEEFELEPDPDAVWDDVLEFLVDLPAAAGRVVLLREWQVLEEEDRSGLLTLIEVIREAMLDWADRDGSAGLIMCGDADEVFVEEAQAGAADLEDLSNAAELAEDHFVEEQQVDQVTDWESQG